MKYQSIAGQMKKYIPKRLRSLIGRVLVKAGLLKIEPAPEKKMQLDIISALEFSSQGNHSAAEGLLLHTFNSNLNAYAGLPHEYIRKFLKAVEQRRSLTSPDNEVIDILLQHTRDLDARCLPCSQWLLLHGACIRNGLFRVAGVVRDNGIEAAYIEASDADAGPDLLIQAFKAAVDQGDFEKAIEVLDRLRSADPANNSIDALQMYYFLNTGDTIKLRALSKGRLKNEDTAFAEYINGKSIAMVGPAPTGEDAGAEIDSFDAVIRFKYQGRQFLPDAKEFGTRIDVSCYGKVPAAQINDLEDISFFDDLRFSIFKSAEYEFQKRLLQSQRGRVLKDNKCFIDGYPNEVQLALFDILRFGPRRVKLFHVNFFLSNAAYHAGYFVTKASEDRSRSIIMRWNSFGGHGLLNQLNFTRNLWQAGLIEADSLCESVFRLTPAEYLSQMEEIYVINAIKEHIRNQGANLDK